MQAIPHKTKAINSLPVSYRKRILEALRARSKADLDLPVIVYYAGYRFTAWSSDLPVEVSPSWT